MITPEQAATLALIGWAGVSAVLTAILRLRTDIEWLAFVERSPKLGFLVVFIRTLGVDPLGAIAAFRLLFRRGIDTANSLPLPSPSSPEPQRDIR
jgi:hypothetical protein